VRQDQLVHMERTVRQDQPTTRENGETGSLVHKERTVRQDQLPQGENGETGSAVREEFCRLERPAPTITDDWNTTEGRGNCYKTLLICS
jgi:hypothetical protein